MIGDPEGKPGDRPLPDGSGNYNPDGTLRDIDAENPSQAEKMKLNYPEDMPSDDAAAEDGAGPGDPGTPGGGSDGDHGHSGGDPQPPHGNDGSHGHGTANDSHGHSSEAPGHGGEGHGQAKGHDK